jgi:hypothetical protein
MNTSSFSTFLQEKIAERGWSLQKVSEASGIAIGHLESLLKGDTDALPAAPYLRGYIVKLGSVLGFDPDPWWKAVQSGGELPRSGATDALPRNRFSRTPVGRYAWLVVVGIVIIAYVIIRFASIFGVPTLAITVPDQDTISTTTSVVTLRGTLTNGTSLKINGDVIPLAADGSWQKEVTLSAGPNPNRFEFVASKLLGRSHTEVRQIVYTPEATSTPGTGTATSTATSSAPTATSSKPTTTKAGATSTIINF